MLIITSIDREFINCFTEKYIDKNQFIKIKHELKWIKSMDTKISIADWAYKCLSENKKIKWNKEYH
ncbi:unnamed protein product, partial [marine sediment metagenome]